MSAADKEVRIPIVEEHLELGKVEVETGRVRVSSRVEEEERLIRDALATTGIRVERRKIDRISDDPPAMHEEGDRLIVPVYEEVLVKRFRIREEVHLITERVSTPVEEKVTLRRNRVDVSRDDGSASRGQEP